MEVAQYLPSERENLIVLDWINDVEETDDVQELQRLYREAPAEVHGHQEYHRLGGYLAGIKVPREQIDETIIDAPKGLRRRGWHVAAQSARIRRQVFLLASLLEEAPLPSRRTSTFPRLEGLTLAMLETVSAG